MKNQYDNLRAAKAIGKIIISLKKYNVIKNLFIDEYTNIMTRAGESGESYIVDLSWREIYRKHVKNIGDSLKAKKLVDNNKLNKLINFKLSAMQLVDGKIITENPYFLNIKFKGNEKFGDIRVGFYNMINNQLIAYDETDCYMGAYFNNIGVLSLNSDETVKIPVINCGNTSWMSVCPSEIKLMESHIKKSHGKVLNFGLGLGYFTYMALLKDNVTSVTAVETNPEMIEFFKKYILPQFGKTEQSKITIIQLDAFEYAKNIRQGQYDYIFYDIWEGIGDGNILYGKAVDSLANLDCDKGYWIEQSIMLSLYNNLLDTIMDMSKLIVMELENNKFKDILLSLWTMGVGREAPEDESVYLGRVMFAYVINIFISVYNGGDAEKQLDFEQFYNTIHKINSGYTIKNCKEYLTYIKGRLNKI